MTILKTIKLNQFSTVIIGYHKSDIAWKDFMKQNYKN
jgi:hypothetical protein